MYNITIATDTTLYTLILVTKMTFNNTTMVTKTLSILLRPFVSIAPKQFKFIWLSNLSIFSVHDEGYSRHASYILILISTLQNTKETNKNGQSRKKLVHDEYRKKQQKTK